MKKNGRIYIVILMLCINLAGITQAIEQNNFSENNQQDYLTHEMIQTYSKYTTPENKQIKSIDQKTIDLPWTYQQTSLLEWWIRIEYNGQTYEQQVPVNINDFKEKFLKHPEYGEILQFDLDSDAANDLEVIVGFYWSIIKDSNGFDVDSLEKRIRVRQLETGGYVDDSDGDLTVWSELHINYGLFQKNGKNKANQESSLLDFLDHFLRKSNTNEYQLMQKATPIQKIFMKLNEIKHFVQNKKLWNNDILETEDEPPLIDENDYISIGAGYRSPQGQDIPRYMEKRFAFARQNIFSPTIFQHIVDPGTSKGKGPLELLYGFRSFSSSSTIPTYDIAFSTQFNPAVYLKTKFIPLGGYVYYYFDSTSQRSSSTEITFTSNILKGVGEGIELSLLFDTIDDSLAQSGKWMSFDIDMIGDNELLGGNIHYKASNTFSVGIQINSPAFEEKIEIIEIPKEIDLSWDLDFILVPSPIFFAHADGYIDLSMSSDLGGINLYYPKTDPSDEDKIFINVPGGIPEDTRVEAAATLNIDLTNLQSSSNYVYGKIKHTCSSNIDSIRAFLPGEEIPIVQVTEIPSYTEAEAKLYWSRLQGHAYMWRGSSGPPDLVEINLQYQGYHIHDILTIRNGHINTRFKIGENGYFFFDTSEGIFGNTLEVNNIESGDAIGLQVDEVSADNLQAEWDIDTSGERLKINNLRFDGMVDTMKGLQLNLDYQGKAADLNLDWVLGQEGYFDIELDQQDDLTLDFSQFALNSSTFDLDGGITISNVIKLDMSWNLKQGDESSSGNVNPGYFTINEHNDEGIIKDFDFYFTYNDKYGVDVTCENLRFYLDFEWWRGDRLLPYIWLDYEVSADDFDVDLLWTDINGETQWYQNVEEW